jgi:hypothetical protein
MRTPAHEDDRRRRGFVLALLGGVLLLAVGLTGGWIAFGADNSANPQYLGSSQGNTPSSGATVVLPAQQAAGEPSAAPVAGTSQGQAATQPSSGGNNGNGSGGNQGHSLDVSGTVVGSVGPGSSAQLVLTISNPNNQDVLLTSVSGNVTSVTSAGIAGKPVCSASWYHVGSFSGSRTIVKGASTTIQLPVTFDDLASTNQDNCKRARYTYSFTAQARQA